MAASFCSINSGLSFWKLGHCFPGNSSLRRSYAGLTKSGLCIEYHDFSSRNYRTILEVKRNIKCQAASTDKLDRENPDNISRATLVWRAIKLPIYSVALVPLSVGSAAAYLQTGVFLARRYFTLLASSILIITWLNLSNDVYDFDTGADKNKKESVVNLLGSRTWTFIVAYTLLALGFSGLAWASTEAGNLRAILLLAAAIACGYIYQCPPFRLSYQGLGEPLCFAAFGPFATTAFYLLQSGFSSSKFIPLTGTVVCSSFIVGLTTTLILFCSHFHQVDDDIAVGKLSPLVRLGTERGSQVVKMAVGILYTLLLAFGLSRDLPFACIILCFLSLPMGNRVVCYVQENHKEKGLIFMAKYYCVRLHALVGASLTAGLVAARLLSNNTYIPRLIFP